MTDADHPDPHTDLHSDPHPDVHPDVVEIPAGLDLGSLEVVKARLDADGIPVRIEPDATGIIPDDADGGYRILLRREDLEAARPVLEAADIGLP